jgi:glycosyltransferase involved in cell wall biosynthesis
MTILFFSDIPWTSLHQRPQHLAGMLAEQTSVVWMEPATLGQKASFTPVAIANNLYGLSLPFVPYNARNSVVRRISHMLSRLSPVRTVLGALQAFLLKRALQTLGLHQQQLFCFVQNFQAVVLLSHLKPDLVIYDCIDNPFGFVDFPPHVRREWRMMLTRADIVTATSPNLQSLIQHEVPRTVHVVSNGVEYERFSSSSADRPADLPADGTPLVGYAGSVYSWLDFDLLQFLCTHAPDLRIILMGPDHPATHEPLRRLAAFPNFSFLGIRPYGSVPAYLHAFDVGIIPFRRTPLTEGVNPVKLYEYSATGLPVVSTDFSPDLQAFQSVITVCHSPEEFLAAVRRAIPLRRLPTQARVLQSFARAHDWRDKGRQVLDLIEEHTSHSPHTATP